jgi:hypothetical protein
MELFILFCYNTGHETPWIPRGTGKAPPTRDRITERKQGDSFSRGALGRSVKELCFPMVPGVPGGWIQGPSFKGDSGASSQAVSNREKQISGSPLVRSADCRVSDRPVDSETDRPNHSQALWHPVSSQSCVAAASRDAMELPETRASGSAKERERGCALESLPVAPYKKKPKNLGPDWSSSMNPASCSSQTFVVPGPRKDKPRSSITSTSRTEFPPSMPWWYRPNGNAWRSTSGFGSGILTVWMFVLSLKSCLNTSETPWSCCGIGARSTVVKRLSSFLQSIQGFIENIFRPMLLNLTLQNMFGIRLTVPFPTVCRRVSRSLGQCYRTQNGGSGDHQGSYGLASMPPISPGPDKSSFHYLYEAQ